MLIEIENHKPFDKYQKFIIYERSQYFWKYQLLGYFKLHSLNLSYHYIANADNIDELIVWANLNLIEITDIKKSDILNYIN